MNLFEMFEDDENTHWAWDPELDELVRKIKFQRSNILEKALQYIRISRN